MDEATRKQIADYVKPLATGLDGMTYYGDIERVVAAARKIAAGQAPLDEDLVYLLAVFSGQEKWVERMGHGSRTEIFLSSLGIPAARIRLLFRGLPRLSREPSTREEAVVYDAVRLDEMGAYGIARRLQEGYRERMDFREIAGAIEQAARASLATPQGEALAAPRRQAMLDFARRLREEFEELS